jgi:hypothetical protein
VFYQYSADGSVWNNNWIHTGSVQTDIGPIDKGSYTAAMNTQEISGCIKIRIFAREEIIPAGVSDGEVSGVFCSARSPSIKIT